LRGGPVGKEIGRFIICRGGILGNEFAAGRGCPQVRNVVLAERRREVWWKWHSLHEKKKRVIIKDGTK